MKAENVSDRISILFIVSFHSQRLEESLCLHIEVFGKVHSEESINEHEFISFSIS